MYGYIALYKGNRCEVYAESAYEAQQKAAKILRTKHSYDVTVVLCERPDGEQVEHSTGAI